MADPSGRDDSETAPNLFPTARALDLADLGAAMRRLRGSLSLRDFEKTSGFSRSQLSAYENGRRLPKLAYAAELDALYGETGWVALAVRTLSRTAWNPWASDRGQEPRHAFSWPAAYGGLVWIKVKPSPEAAGRRHRLVSEWGPWGRADEVELPADGVVLLQGKATDGDGISRTYNLTADAPVYALAGSGSDLPRELVIDIRRGWEIVNRDARDDELKHGPSEEAP